MNRCIHLVAVLIAMFALAGIAEARWVFADIIGIDADKRIVEYRITFGKARGTDVKVTIAKDCQVKEGYYRLGKPATTKVGDDIPMASRMGCFARQASTIP